MTYLRDGIGVAAPILSDGSAQFTPGTSTKTGSSTTSQSGNHNGNIGLETNSSQGVTGTRQYDAFGNRVSTTGAPVGSAGFAAQYGYQEDADSSLVLVGHRYYDPSSGRFITRDPAKVGRSWYTYCQNNGLRFVDPSGLADIFTDPPGGYPPGDGGGMGVYQTLNPGYVVQTNGGSGGWVTEPGANGQYSCLPPSRMPGGIPSEPEFWRINTPTMVRTSVVNDYPEWEVFGSGQGGNIQHALQNGLQIGDVAESIPTPPGLTFELGPMVSSFRNTTMGILGVLGSINILKSISRILQHDQTYYMDYDGSVLTRGEWISKHNEDPEPFMS